MDWQLRPTERYWDRSSSTERRKVWVRHTQHEAAMGTPHRVFKAPSGTSNKGARVVSSAVVTLDGSQGEGGGQILRTALTLSLLTGKPFRMTKIRANRDRPGLRPQHLTAVEAAAELGNAEVKGAAVGARELSFRPGVYEPRDLMIDIGTAGSTCLVLQTLHLPLAMQAVKPVRVTLEGGTFNPKAPAFPFVDSTWRAHLAKFGMSLSVVMPSAGFYPRGGGQLDAWIEPGNPRSFIATSRGPITRIHGVAGVANLRPDIAQRMRDRALARLAQYGLAAEIELADWRSPGQGAAISLVVEHEGSVPATFVGLGERGKPSEVVADEAVMELLAFESVRSAAVDAHSADQILLPLALAKGHSEYTVAEITEHLRTNVATIQAFVEREISIVEPHGETPGRVVIGG